MEPGALEWLLLYEQTVLAPRGLSLEVVTATRGEQTGWEAVFEPASGKWHLPSIIQRSCTDRLKIRPINAWRARELAGCTVTWIIGFRADETSERRRLQPSRFLDEETGDLHWRPFVELGVGLDGVRALLAGAGMPEPEIYTWSTRSGCLVCHFARARTLKEASRRRPAEYRAAEHGEQTVISLRGRGAAPWVAKFGATLREIREAAESELDLFDEYGDALPEDECPHDMGVCSL